jgi:hypothetical protein
MGKGEGRRCGNKISVNERRKGGREGERRGSKVIEDRIK